MTTIEETDAYKDTRKLVLKKLAVVCGLILLAAVTGMASFFGFAKPKGHELDIWFARSGSLITVLALFSQLRSVELFEMLTPRGLGSLATSAIRDRYRLVIRGANWAGIATAVVGTIIWGYGDLVI